MVGHCLVSKDWCSLHSGVTAPRALYGSSENEKYLGKKEN